MVTCACTSYNDKRRTFTFSVNLTILKVYDRHDRPDRLCGRIDAHHAHGRTRFICIFLIRYPEFKGVFISAIVMCICVCTFCADDRLSIALNFCAMHMQGSAFDRHRVTGSRPQRRDKPPNGGKYPATHSQF
jgi:hypothetical protein